jgi:hypothetical protein
MIQRQKIDLILLFVGMTFLAYSIFGSNWIDEDVFRFIIGLELVLGSLYLISAPLNRWY